MILQIRIQYLEKCRIFASGHIDADDHVKLMFTGGGFLGQKKTTSATKDSPKGHTHSFVATPQRNNLRKMAVIEAAMGQDDEAVDQDWKFYFA